MISKREKLIWSFALILVGVFLLLVPLGNFNMDKQAQETIMTIGVILDIFGIIAFLISLFF